MLRPAPISLDPSDIPPGSSFKPFIERGTTDQTTPGRSYSLQLVGGAGGLQDIAGDYLYQDQKLARSVEGGAWGILRVQPDIDPLKNTQYLIDDIRNSKAIPDIAKPVLIDEVQKILDNLLSHDQTRVDEICQDIIPNLLKEISGYEELGGRDGTEYAIDYTPYDDSDGYATDYDTYSDSYSSAYGSDFNTYDYSTVAAYAQNEGKEDYKEGEKDSYYSDDQYNNDNTLTLEKLAEELRNIAYAVC
jgi:hypothetical protein